MTLFRCTYSAEAPSAALGNVCHLPAHIQVQVQVLAAWLYLTVVVALFWRKVIGWWLQGDFSSACNTNA